MAERDIEGEKLYEKPVSGKENKFVITEEEGWFLPFEDNTVAPTLSEILTAVVDADFSDPKVVEDYDRRLENGLVLLGYVSKDTGAVSVHLPDESIGEDMKGRLDEVFGEGTVYG
jgi:hypothetical protein